MSLLYTSRNMLALWLIRRGLRMLSKPCWAIGAIGLPMPSPGKLAAHTINIAPAWDRERSVVSSGLCVLLCDIVSGKAISSEFPGSFCRHDRDQENDGSPDAKSLH